MTHDLVVAAYWWQPDAGSKFAHAYGADDVRRLARQVARNLTVPHEFACITDRPHVFSGDDGIRAIPIDMTTHVPGTCFVRLMTFHPDAGNLIGKRILQLDLDAAITGSLNDIAQRMLESRLILWRNPARVPWESPVYGANRPYYNASILAHECGTMPDIRYKFDPKSPRVRDDQWLFGEYFGPGMQYFDGEDGIYRLARADTPGSGVWGELPENARIVFFPGSEGKPDRPEILDANPWIARFQS